MNNRIMVYFLAVFTFLGSVNLFSQSAQDTSFTATMKFDGNKHKINVKFLENKKNWDNSCFVIKVDNTEIVDSIVSDYFEVRLVDLNKDDNFDEILLVKYIEEETDASIFRYDGTKITKLGDIYTMDEFGIAGDGKIKVRGWMGFWYYDFEFVYNESKNQFEPQYKDLYDIKTFVEDEGDKYEVIAKESFKVLEDKSDDAKTKFEIKKGEQIKILQAYVKQDCNNEEVYLCHWYYIQNAKGEKGWIRLRNFVDKVDGIPWAG